MTTQSNPPPVPSFASINALKKQAGWQELLQELSELPAGQFKALLLSPNPICIDDAYLGMPSDIPQPMRVSQAMEIYRTTVHADLKPRTLTARIRAIGELTRHMGMGTLEGEFDPWLHQISPLHLTSYLNTLKEGGVRCKGGALADPVSAKTLESRMSHFAAIFQWACDEVSACKMNPMDALEKRRERNRKTMHAEDVPFRPFTDQHLKCIFDPWAYLEANSKADLFWVPLVCAHMGMRLSEVATLSIDAVTLNDSGIWSLQVPKSIAKNGNSERKVPVSETLIELGFIRYVEHVRALGAKRLFPHRNETITSTLMPYKACGEAFSRYLQARGIKEEGLVFHSFRHTVVSEMSTIGVPVAIAQNVTGHAAQDAAVKRGELTVKQARSVFFRRYSQLKVPRLNVACPLTPLKQAVDQIVLPVDYERLKIAAEIVRQHTVRQGNSFKSGWARQNRKYAAKQLNHLSSN